tara:strand:+ start:960 stop:1271 length:312 start_codon:yes stop_codon:yes gene_type:complete
VAPVVEVAVRELTTPTSEVLVLSDRALPVVRQAELIKTAVEEAVLEALGRCLLRALVFLPALLGHRLLDPSGVAEITPLLGALTLEPAEAERPQPQATEVRAL